MRRKNGRALRLGNGYACSLRSRRTNGVIKWQLKEAFYPLKEWDRYDKISDSMAIKVTRKDQNEANENIIRRFNRKVLQSGVMAEAKESMRFSKPISKRERRNKAILRDKRKAEKAERMKLGLK